MAWEPGWAGEAWLRVEMPNKVKAQGKSGGSAGESECTVCLKGKKCTSEAVARPIEVIRARDGPYGRPVRTYVLGGKSRRDH